MRKQYLFHLVWSYSQPIIIIISLSHVLYSILILFSLSFPALYIVGFAICLFLLYNLMPIAMQFSSATVVNLSLLTADFYSLLCGIFLFRYKVSFFACKFSLLLRFYTVKGKILFTPCIKIRKLQVKLIHFLPPVKLSMATCMFAAHLECTLAK